MSDAASILYPDDPPRDAPTREPAWVAADRTAAAARLSRTTDAPDAAELLYPDDQPREPEPPSEDEPSPREKTVDEIGREREEAGIRSVFSSMALAAIKDGDKPRADELIAAEKALTADMRAAGTKAEDFSNAMTIINERGYEARTDEQREAEGVQAVDMLRGEIGATFDADLGAARAFIQDLEKVAPGTIRTLEMSGAGNDVRMIRAAIREAKRRGYGR